MALSDLNDRIADKIDDADLDPDQEALLDKLLGKDYEVITADERLERIAADFVEHCSTRWESGKSMLVCIDKITCARMLQLIRPLWSAKAASVRSAADAKRAEALAAVDSEVRAVREEEGGKLAAQAAWLEETVVGLIISEAQNEVRDFWRWDFDIIPHRDLMKRGFDGADGKRIDVEKAFKNPDHPFRVAVVCAMWLTGFDVECLSTLYIDKPMKAHNLMQAIARANRVWPGKDHGLIVDYNGVLKSLREALAQYALGEDGTGGEEIIVPIEERVQSLIEAIEATEAHLRRLGFDPGTLIGSSGFARIKGLKDAVEGRPRKRRQQAPLRDRCPRGVQPFQGAVDGAVRVRLRRTARQHRGDLQEALRGARQCRCHGSAERVASDRETRRSARRRPGGDQIEGVKLDLSEIDMEKLREEFAKKVRRKATTLRDIREIVEAKLAEMLARNPTRMDYQQKYEEIVADYNREKDRVTAEETFRRLVELVEELDVEQNRAVEEGLSEEEMALFDMLRKDGLGKADRERVKQASRDLLASIEARLRELDRFWEKEQTKAEVRVFILDQIHMKLPTPPFSPDDIETVAGEVYEHVWQRAVRGDFSMAA